MDIWLYSLSFPTKSLNYSFSSTIYPDYICCLLFTYILLWTSFTLRILFAFEPFTIPIKCWEHVWNALGTPSLFSKWEHVLNVLRTLISMLRLWTDFCRFFTILFNLIFTFYRTEIKQLQHTATLSWDFITCTKKFWMHSLMTPRPCQACGIAPNLYQWKDMHNYLVSVTSWIIDKWRVHAELCQTQLSCNEIYWCKMVN